jgi:hypothetical protein
MTAPTTMISAGAAGRVGAGVVDGACADRLGVLLATARE